MRGLNFFGFCLGYIFIGHKEGLSFIDHAPHPPRSPTWGSALGKTHQGYIVNILMLVIDNLVLSLDFHSQDNYSPRTERSIGLSSVWLTLQPLPSNSEFLPKHWKRANMTSWLIRSGLSDYLSNPVKWSVASHMISLVARSRTAQPPGSCP